VKSFGVTFDFVLYELSYANLVLYSAVLPTYNSDKEGKKGKSGDRFYDCDNKEDAEKARRYLLGE